ncbi:MAG: ATP-dependent 6-phosphofructokinase [Thermomicrobiales bacterium]|nr:ATP-dependent 6-phosphofructokinase [Thermomicrobiales bacterium]
MEITSTQKTIGIVNSGGDCAGINTVIASAVIAGIRMGYQFVGFELGWEGLIDRKYRKLDLEDAGRIQNLGGTVLHTTNRGRFAAKVGQNQTNKIDPEILEACKRSVDELGIDGLLVIGGDGTLSGALQLAETGVNIVGIPKSIDNDLYATEHTFGFATAVEVAVEAIDRIQTTAFSHNRIFFVECMGRNAGWLSLYAGLAAGADAILLPEFPTSLDDIVEFLRYRRDRHRNSTIIVVSEAFEIEGKAVTQGSSVTNEVIFSGISNELIRRLEELAPHEFEMRNVVLGHTQRGGSPCAEDRILSKRFGTRAMEAYDRGLFGHMVALQQGQIHPVPIKDAVDRLKLVTKENNIYEAARRTGIFLGDLQDYLATARPDNMANMPYMISAK